MIRSTSSASSSASSASIDSRRLIRIPWASTALIPGGSSYDPSGFPTNRHDRITDESRPFGPADFVRLYTDGACSGNPGPGGWAYILEHPASGRVVDASGAEPATTNNRMELTGAIEGLASLKRRCKVELVTDSEYVGKGMRDWMPKWKSQGWRRKEGKSYKPVVNLDLWQRLDELLAGHDVKVAIVLGHNGHEQNEACDRMAVAAYKAMVADARQ